MGGGSNRRKGEGPDGFVLADLTPPFLKRRAAFYIDGFNLHHSILDLGRRELLWLDLAALGKLIIARNERLVGTVWVSAHKPQKRDRMTALYAYEQALRGRGVRCLMGHFVLHGDHCHACGHQWMDATEKQSDVNLALAVAADAAADRFDVAYILTTDGDHAATARFVKESYPNKRVVSVAPPGRHHNRQIIPWCDAKVSIERKMLDRAALPDRVRSGRTWVERPQSWRPRDPVPETPPPGPPPAGTKPGHLRLVVSNG